MATMISKSSLRDSYQDVSGMLTANSFEWQLQHPIRRLRSSVQTSWSQRGRSVRGCSPRATLSVRAWVRADCVLGEL